VTRNEAKKAILALIGRKIASEDMSATRAMYFGGAGASLAIVLLVAQLQPKTPALYVGLACAAFAMPIWVGLAMGQHLWLTLKLEYSDFADNEALLKLVNIGSSAVYALFLLSIGALIWEQSKVVALMFISAVVASIAAGVYAMRIAFVTAFQKENG